MFTAGASPCFVHHLVCVLVAQMAKFRCFQPALVIKKILNFKIVPVFVVTGMSIPSS
jgi:hypothetical protein